MGLKGRVGERQQVKGWGWGKGGGNGGNGAGKGARHGRAEMGWGKCGEGEGAGRGREVVWQKWGWYRRGEKESSNAGMCVCSKSVCAHVKAEVVGMVGKNTTCNVTLVLCMPCYVC